MPAAQKVTLAAAAAAAAVLLGATTLAAGQPAFDWASITPSADLVWQRCTPGFECARLLVPYDWQDRSDERTMALALQKLPAAVPDDDPRFGGAIFTNPGGPGHSGTLVMASAGEALRRAIDSPGRRHHEIISWDPRGVGQSTPRVECLGRPHDVSSYTLESRGYRALDAGPASVAYALGIFHGVGLQCRRRMEEGLDVLPYLGTTDVVDDLRHMVELVDASRRRRSSNATASGRSESRGVARLQYYGFSYGTVIGQMFAARYPGAVGRIALDGVVDMDDYMAAPGWLTSTENMDACADHFVELCFRKNTRCALYRQGDACASEIKRRLESFIQRLDKRPEAALTSDGRRAVVTGHDLRLVFGTVAYSPVHNYEAYAQAVASAMRGDYTLVLAMLEQMGEYPNLDRECAASTSPAATNSIDSVASIYCLDANDLRGRDFEYWAGYAATMGSTSRWFGFSIAQIQFACSNWPVRPKNRFTGPFTSPAAAATTGGGRGGDEGSPAAPLLFLSTRLDPVSPLASARRMQGQHAGAGLLVQGSSGHTTLGSAPSRCRDEALRAYFERGAVPDGELLCGEDCGPWDAGCAVLGGNSSVNVRGFEGRSGHQGDFPLFLSTLIR